MANSSGAHLTCAKFQRRRVVAPTHELLKAATLKEVVMVGGSNPKKVDYKCYQGPYGNDDASKVVLLPRYFDTELQFIESTPNRDWCEHALGRRRPTSSMDFVGELRAKNKQPEAVAAALEQMRKPGRLGGGGALVVMPTGTGKSIVALKVASELKERTLIIVHTNDALLEYTRTIAKFMPDTPCHKFAEPSAAAWGSEKHSALRASEQGADIVIATMQSLVRVEPYPPTGLVGGALDPAEERTCHQYGLVIVDECHKAACQTIQACVSLTNAKYTLGLTATLERADNLVQLVPWLVGPVCFQTEREFDPDQKFALRVLDHAMHRSPLPHWWKPGDAIRVTHLTSAVAADDTRTKKIARYVTETLLQKEDRRVLVLTATRGHAKELVKEIGGDNTHLMLGGATHKQQEELKDRIGERVHEPGFCLVASYGLGGTGFNLPRLDAVVLASPVTGQVKQAVGRITRPHPDNLPTKVVVDIYDQVPGAMAEMADNIFKKRVKLMNEVLPQLDMNVVVMDT